MKPLGILQKPQRDNWDNWTSIFYARVEKKKNLHRMIINRLDYTFNNY